MRQLPVNHINIYYLFTFVYLHIYIEKYYVQTGHSHTYMYKIIYYNIVSVFRV
jgi:hypothetical protein